MADGNVRFLSDKISPEVFKAMCTINGPAPRFDIEKEAPKIETPTGEEEQAPAAGNQATVTPAPQGQPQPPAQPGQGKKE
jgi:hypothetical protein